MEEAEIMHFQAVINDYNGIIEFDENHNSPKADGMSFELLCHQKRSEYSDNQVVLTNASQIIENSKSLDNRTGSTLTVYSMGSFEADTPGTRQSSHCARVCWNQHNIPRITNYPVGQERRSPSLSKADSPNKSSKSEQTSITTFVRDRVIGSYEAWKNIPKYVQYYLLCITVGFVAMIYGKMP